MTDKPLTAKQRDWVRHYTDPAGEGYNNATASARLAGYSKRSARQMGADTLSKPYVKAAIEAKQAIIADRANITREEVVNNARWLVDHGMATGKANAVSSGNAQLAAIGGYTTDAKQGVTMPTINVHLPETPSKPQASSSPVFKLRKPEAG